MVLHWTQSCFLNFPVKFYRLSCCKQPPLQSCNGFNLDTFLKLFLIIHQQKVP
jgi:hypothetical protein